MNQEKNYTLDEFMALDKSEIRRLILKNGKPKTGLFSADGNRRLLTALTEINSNSNEFYTQYAKIFVDSLRNSLEIFFDYGLETLFFPLFGPSLLIRKNKFQSITIPLVFKSIFQNEEGFLFFKERGIRVRVYGDLLHLEKIDIHGLHMAIGINDIVKKTSSYKNHTLYFGFMSDNTTGFELPQTIIDFYKKHNRIPLQKELIEIYYNEAVLPIDFIIFSDKLSHRVLPPFIYTNKAVEYFLPVPGFHGFSNNTYRKVLYDLIFVQPGDSIEEYSDESFQNRNSLLNFYNSNKDKIIGLRKKIGQFSVPIVD